MKREPIDFLLQLAYLEGNITTHGLYERSVGRRHMKALPPTVAAERLLLRLEAALSNRLLQHQPLTIGELLRDVRKKHALGPHAVFSRLGVSANVYAMMEHDRISPLKIPAEAWKKLVIFVRIPVESMAELIRRTHQLVWFRPSFRTTLARYDARKNRALKASTLERAATELFSKASLQLPPQEEAKLQDLFKKISQ